MSWFLPFAGLEKKICRYLLQRYLGRFLCEKLNLEQLNVDLRNGKGTVKDVALNCEAINELCESQGLGIELTGGHVGAVTITVPWNAPMTDDSYIEVSNLCVTLRPLPRKSDGSSMLESMWSSMSSSMQLAQECLEKGNEDCNFNSNDATIEGLETFAQTIDNVLNRIKAKLENTEIRLEYLPPNHNCGIAIIIKINCLTYQNEAGNDPYDKQSDFDYENNDKRKTHLISTYATHNIKMEGITFYTEEFRICSDITDTAENIKAEKENIFVSGQQFYSVLSNLTTSSFDSTIIQNEHLILEETIVDNKKKLSTDSMKIAQFVGNHLIRIQMKQSETINGPKVSLDIQLGSIFIFLSPRQLHLLLDFYDVFIKDQQLHQPIKIEEHNSKARDLQKKISSNMTGVIGNLGGWSCDLVNETSSISSIKQCPNKINNFGLYHNKSKTFEYCESINSSMTNSSSTSFSSRFQRKAANRELNGEISQFNICCASIRVVLLDEDILVENSSTIGFPVSAESVSQLINQSNLYFNSINKNLSTIENFNCNKNHITLFFAPIIVEGEQQRSSSFIILKLTIAITRADLHEVLDNTAKSLIEFDRKQIADGFHKRPEITILLKTSTPTNFGTQTKKPSNMSKTEINFNLESCTVELDITLYDRLFAVINGSPFLKLQNNSEMVNSYENVMQQNEKHLETTIDFKLDSTKIDLRLRFPIVDSRPLHDPKKIPWWKQNIRPDFILFSFFQFRLKNSSTFVEICANEIDIFYCETLQSQPIKICRTSFVDNSGIASQEPYVEYPIITIEFPSEKSLRTTLKCSVDDSDSGETSGESFSLYKGQNCEPLPFSSKRVCRQSDTPHLKDDIEIDDSETILLPAEAAEMKKFCEKAMKTSKLQFKVFLPEASVQIKSKMLYEIIYNRFNSDLLMWEPHAPNYLKKKNKLYNNSSKTKPSIDMLWRSGLIDSLYIPTTSKKKSNLQTDKCCDEKSSGSSDGIDTECESDSIYYSTYEKTRTKRSQSITNRFLSACSFELNVKHAIATLFSPVRDSENRVLPEQLGEYVIEVKSLIFFSVSGFNGNDNLSYLCIQSKSINLYHCGLKPTEDPILRIFNSDLPCYLLQTIYPTPPDLTFNSSKDLEKRDMISFAVEIKKIPDQRIKRLRLTAGIHNTTLRHNPAIAQHNWINQFIDFFDVLDYPIEGYEPYGIVTEMQLHLWDCSVDYMPLHFPFRAVIEIGSFMLSSNLISSVTGCTLRFISEDCILFLAPYNNDEIPDTLPVSSKSLVPVLDMGLLDISLRLNDKTTDIFPNLDLRASIQDMHIRTCSDSSHALALLIGYIASDGDLNKAYEEDTSSIPFSSEETTELLVVQGSENLTSQISAKQQELVNTLMAEAIKETNGSDEFLIGSEETEYITDKGGIDLYFFPDENQLKQMNHFDIGSISKNFNKSQDTNERISSSESVQTLTGVCSNLTRSNSVEWVSKPRNESESSNEMRDLLNFENNVMNLSYVIEDEAVEALPQIREELGEISHKVLNKDSDNKSKRSSLNLDDEFYVIADEEKAFISKCGIKDLKVTSDPLRIVDNHFTSPIGKPDLLKAPEGFPTAVLRYTLCEMTVTWHLYGGCDFPEKEKCQKASNGNKENIFPRQKTEMSDAYKLGVSYSKGQNIQFGKKPISKICSKNRGGIKRNHDVLVEIQLTKVRFSHEIYPLHTTQASRQVILISEIEIRDRLKTSDINKFLYNPKTNHLPKSSQHMVIIKALHVRPNLQTAQECSLRVSLLPLRLNIDQDTLLFLFQFFNHLGSSVNENEKDNMLSNKKGSFFQMQEPVMMVDDMPEAVHDLHARKMISTNLELLMEDDKSHKPSYKEINSRLQKKENDIPLYFKEIIFSPEVLIRLDYHGRRIEMSRGPLAGLLMGLGQLQCSEIRLKKIIHKHGILGFDKLLHFLFREWLQDIKKNQLPTILSGVGPMYTFVQLFQGIRDLFWLPIEQYQKDGRIIRGLQLGAQSFTARTALAALEITSRIIQLLQITAETAFDMVSPGPSLRRIRQNRKGKRKRPHRPQDIREGVANACQIFKDGINDTASALIENTIVEHDQKGYSGAVGALLRQIPPLVVCPVVLATQATTNVLGGVKNQLVPDARFEAHEKWKGDAD